MTDAQEESYRNGYCNLIGCIEDYASREFASQIAQPGGPTKFDARMTLTELSLCFADVDYVFADPGPRMLSLSHSCVERLRAFQFAINALVDGANDLRRKSDAEIVESPEWERIQVAARDLLLLLPKP